MANRTGIGTLIWLLAPLYSWRAARGARRMDAKAEDWAQKINKDKLDFGDDCDCIIGQGIGSFPAHAPEVVGTTKAVGFAFGVIENGFAAGYMVTLGLLIRGAFSFPIKSPSPLRLEWAWIHQIDQRLVADKAAFAVENGP